MSEASLVVSVKEWLAGGIAMATVSAMLNPTDVVKVRMQTCGELGHGVREYSGFRQTTIKILQEEGLWGIYKPGLATTCIREMTYGGLSFALYPVFKRVFGLESDTAGMGRKLCSGFVSGMISSGLTTPVDVVKIRLQQNSGRVVNGVFVSGMFKGEKPMFTGFFNCLSTLYFNYGFMGLYKGCYPVMIRSACLKAAQLSSYDQTKAFLRSLGYTEGPVMHFGAGIVAGFACATAAAPADIIKTRIQCDPDRKLYKGPTEAFMKLIQAEGPMVLFRGWWPSFLRLGPHNITSIPLMEVCRRLMGLNYYAN